MTATQHKRLIEELMPLAEIGKESSKSVAYGDIHAIHTWFARRPLPACRAAAFAALVNAPATEEDRDELLALITMALPNTAPFESPEVIAAMRRRILDTFDGQPPRVLDAFAGGGSLPLEAARLGCETHALDLNPVALLTMLGTVDYPMRLREALIQLPSLSEDLFLEGAAGLRKGTLADAVKAWGNWVFQHVRPDLEMFYLPEPGGRVAVAYLWAKTIRCTNPACKAEVPLVARRWLRTSTSSCRVAFKLVPQRDRTLGIEIMEGRQAEADDPSRGTMARGSTQCPFCPQTVSPAEVKAQAMGNGLGRMLLAVVTRSATASGTHFRPPTPADMEAFQRVKARLAAAEAAHDDPFFPLVPDEPMPDQGVYGVYPQAYGVRTWGQMHNPRQSLALTTFARGIQAAYREMLQVKIPEDHAKAVSLYLAFALSSMVVKMSEASRWNDRKVESATGGHRLPMLWDYAEVNPLSGSSGSWESALKTILPSLERLLTVDAEAAMVRWGDAAELPYPDNFFDAVLTDPPYYDSVPYGHLSDMQYVWLHRAIGDLFPEYFPAPLTPKNAEIVQDRARHGSDAQAKAFFESKLSQALSEIRRVLRPDGIALVMYSHTATSAWESLVSALIGAGFQVTASWPVNTETTSRREWLGGAVLAATIFLVCRKRPGSRVGYLDEILPEMREQVRRSLARFWAAGIGGADFFISAIGPALSVYSRYSEVRYSSGQPVSVANFLVLVRRAVVDFSLERALAGVDIGEVDRETQFALLWRWTYDHQHVETGAALLLDKATGVELSELERQGLVTRVENGQKMVLLSPPERPDFLGKTLRRAMAGHARLIDVIHCATLLWRDNRREELGELLATQGDAMRKVAQALADLQAESSEERRLILGFLGAWRIGVGPRLQPKRSGQLPLGI